MTKLPKLLTMLTLLWSVFNAFALEVTPYSPEAFLNAQKANQPVALQFHAKWCITCLIQEQVIDQLKADPALKLTVLVVDYDNEKELRKELRVPAQSVILVYHGSKEITMLAGVTDKARIRSAFLSAL